MRTTATTRRGLTWSPSPCTPVALSRCAAPTWTPTRSSRPSTSSGSPAPASRTACSPPGATTPTSCSTGPRPPGRRILVAGPDFGTGSSREHAVWALAELRVPGRHLLAVRRHLPGQRRQGRAAHGLRRPARGRAALDLARGRPGHRGHRRPGRADRLLGRSRPCAFEIDDYTRWRLLEGLDDIDLTLLSRRCGRGIRGPPPVLAAHHRLTAADFGPPSGGTR